MDVPTRQALTPARLGRAMGTSTLVSVPSPMEIWGYPVHALRHTAVLLPSQRRAAMGWGLQQTDFQQLTGHWWYGYGCSLGQWQGTACQPVPRADPDRLPSKLGSLKLCFQKERRSHSHQLPGSPKKGSTGELDHHCQGWSCKMDLQGAQQPQQLSWADPAQALPRLRSETADRCSALHTSGFLSHTAKETWDKGPPILEEHSIPVVEGRCNHGVQVQSQASTSALEIPRG